MKYIFDEKVSGLDCSIDVRHLSDKQIQTCLEFLPDLEIICKIERMKAFSYDKEGWFTSYAVDKSETVIKFEEVFSDE